MFKCSICGRLFFEEDFVNRRECVGEYWGTPAYKTFTYTPCGHNDWEEEGEEMEEDDDLDWRFDNVKIH